MAEQRDGGNAFPHEMGDQRAKSRGGMSLRDWFAGQALVFLAHPNDSCGNEQAARAAYKIADAMLAEREKSDG